MKNDQKKEIGLPLLALFLDFAPILVFHLGVTEYISNTFMPIIVILSPIVGVVLGITALAKGEERIGLFGKAISIIAVAVPVSLVALVILFFVGASTGIISFM